jgi:ABC-2 type transport system ATP-binding protein
MYSLETTKLSYSFSKGAPTLNDIDLKVPKGSIYGFLGKNGAGKTTTLKLVLGLLKKQQGEIRIFNQELNSNRLNILSRLGSLIESPSFYGHLSAEENLKILQKIYQCPKQRIHEVLNIVGLADCGTKKVNQFSLGMKQRLSIGIALLHEPELLILDEPTNGLDPKGIIEIRELLTKVNTELGTTIIISSHLLSEIEKLVTHIAIINKGELLFQGEMRELKAKSLSTMVIETSNPNLVSEAANKYHVNCRQEGQLSFLSNHSKEIIASIVKDLVLRDVSIYKVDQQEMSLESIFINLTQNEA